MTALMPMFIVAGVLVAIILVRNRMSPGAALLGAVFVLLISRTISAEDALGGFASPAVATVAALYIVARAMQRTDALGPVLRMIMGPPGWRVGLSGLLACSAAVSAFINNTPIVAMLAPAVTGYADERKRPPSRYLLPLVYAVSLGGTITLIGTSTNLVVSGLMSRAHMRPLGMFELTPLGLAIAVIGIGILILVTPFILVDRRSPRASLQEADRDFAIVMTVVPGGVLDGRSVEAAGLRHLQGVFLIEIDRAGEIIAPVTPSTELASGDRLTFVGRADDIVDLEKIKGLRSSEESHLASFDPNRHPFFEAVLGPGSPLVGKTLKEIGFRARYHGAVVSIHRNGERIRAKLGSVRLRSGDTLLFMADPGFQRNDFLLVTRIGTQVYRNRRSRGRWVGLLFVGIVLCSGLGLLPLLEASLLAAVLVIVLKLVTTSEIRQAIDIEVLIAIAGSLALGTAVESSGLGRVMGNAVVTVSAFLGPRGALLAILLVTIGFAQIVTCNAAAAICVPIAVASAQRMGLDCRPFLIAVTIGASSTYLTPLGYQTKMMVYGPGGYRFSDYFRLGVPVTIAVVVVTVTMVPMLWPF